MTIYNLALIWSINLTPIKKKIGALHLYTYLYFVYPVSIGTFLKYLLNLYSSPFINPQTNTICIDLSRVLFNK